VSSFFNFLVLIVTDFLYLCNIVECVSLHFLALSTRSLVGAVSRYMTSLNTTVAVSLRDYQIPSDKNTRHLICLNDIRAKLPPLLDIPVGLLLGTDSPEALAPINYSVGRNKTPLLPVYQITITW